MSGDPRPTSRDLLPGMVLVWTGPERVPIDRTKVIMRRKDTDDGWWATDGSGLADYVWDNPSGWWTTLDLLLAANALAALDAHDEALFDGIVAAPDRTAPRRTVTVNRAVVVAALDAWQQYVECDGDTITGFLDYAAAWDALAEAMVELNAEVQG